MGLGCDTATKVNSSRLNAIQNEGMSFIGRYLNRLEGSHDELTYDEINLICGAGLYIYSIYQASGTTGTSHFNYANGENDADDAIYLAPNLGQPGNTPIYFAVDFDATIEQIVNYIVPYFQGVLSKLQNSEYRLGIYGSRQVCGYIRGSYSPTERYTFISDNSWSGDFDDWNLRQYNWDTTIGSGSSAINVDYNESSSYGGGGWQI